MRVILLLGSGISLPTLGDNGRIENITTSILNNPFHRYTDGRWLPGPDPRGNSWEAQNPFHKIKSFLQELQKAVSDQVYNTNDRKLNYEDIYYIIQQVKEVLKDKRYDPAVRPFAEQLSARVQNLCDPSSYETPSYLAEESLNLIQYAVKHALWHNGLSCGLDFINELINDSNIKQLFIATLNHDILVEEMMVSYGFEFSNGFGEWDGDYRWFCPKLLDELPRVVLLKLHGSINWYWLPDRREYGIVKWPGIDGYPKDEVGNHWDLFGTPVFLCGTYNKETEYNHGLFREMHWQFHRALWKIGCHRMIISGYGWRDDGINRILNGWLFGDDSNRIVWLHRSPEKVVDSSNSRIIRERERLAREERLIIIRKWLKDTTLNNIKSHMT